MKRFSMVLGLVLVMSLVFVGAAYANFGPHGGYITDTDSCAGCHRAHSSFSSVKFTPANGGELLTEAEKPSALLVGSASTMSEFCNACHGDLAPGAATNVVQGVFDSGPSSANLGAIGSSNGGVTVAYVTASTAGAPLNGGGFLQMPDPDNALVPTNVTSTHTMEKVGILWGAGTGANKSLSPLTCTDCHDPHGSSNYRLLKDSVNGHAVGGYNPDDSPNGMVFSSETGYPYGDNGWKKHTDGQTQMAAYRPNYTSNSSQVLAGVKGDSLSTWCSACHENYNETAGTTAGGPTGTTNYGAAEGFANGGTGVGAVARHRHPVDIALASGDANLYVQPITDARIPLEQVYNSNPTDPQDPRANHIGCLTCHYAHGSASTMTGWAGAHLEKPASTWIPVRDGIAGVDPDKADDQTAANSGTSALLRADNRGVCERCHNK